MIKFDFEDSIVLEQQKVLEAALSTNPNTQKALQKLVRKVLIEARAKVVNNIHSSKTLKHDPREAARAVRTVVYRKIFGGNINIYNSRKAHGQTSYQPPRKGSNGRGGNRRKRSYNTTRIMSYAGWDRGFILRWANEGTQDRSIEFNYNPRRHVDKWNKHPNTGNRSRVPSYDFFLRYGQGAITQAAENLAELIDTELENMLNKKK